MISVVSSNLKAVDYNNGTLQIAFHSGGVYLYFDVPEQEFVNLINASSKGRYFAMYIKGHYSYRRVV